MEGHFLYLFLFILLTTLAVDAQDPTDPPGTGGQDPPPGGSPQQEGKAGFPTQEGRQGFPLQNDNRTLTQLENSTAYPWEGPSGFPPGEGGERFPPGEGPSGFPPGEGSSGFPPGEGPVTTEPDAQGSGYLPPQPPGPPPKGESGVCGRSLEARAYRGVLVSPGYPRKYPRNMQCNWNITGDSSIQLVITNLDIEDEGEQCPYDHLTVTDGDGQTFPRLCGQIDSRELTLTPPVSLSFVSDDSVELSGFMIQYSLTDTTNQAPGAPQCGYTVEAAFGYLTSPGYPDPYPNDTNCTWILRGPVGRPLTLTFTSIEVEDDPYCRLDKVLVYAGQKDPQPDVLCGKQSDVTIRSDDHVIRVVLRSDDRGQYPGFTAQFYSEGGGASLTTTTTAPDSSAVCSVVPELSEYVQGVLTSPYFPEPYPAGLNCSWMLRAPRDHVVWVIFLQFDLEEEKASSYLCEAAGVSLLDGPNQIATFCGSTLPGGNRGIISRGPSLTLNFYSVTNAQEHTGFVLEYTTIDRRDVVGQERPGDSSGAGPPLDDSVFECENGLRIPLVDTCNQVSECGDGSDEDPETAGCGETYECDDETVILYSEVCDGYRHCPDGSDEGEQADCTAYFPCSDGTIIPGTYRCDGSRDCADGSDEGLVNGCPGDPCAEEPCENGGVCVAGSGGEFSCTCQPGWSGPTCADDVDDGCVGKPCRNGGTCYDQTEGVRCACAAGYYGDRCETVVSVSTSYKLYVSLDNGSDSLTCGSADLPCQSLQLAVARAPAGAVLELGGAEDAAFTLEGVWVSRSVVLRGDGALLTFRDTVVAGSPEGRPTLGLQGLVVTGELWVGDAALQVARCAVTAFTVRQDHQRRATSGSVSYSFEDSALSHSRLLTQDPEPLPAGYTYAPYRATVSLGGCILNQTLVDVRASRADVRLAGTTTTGQGGGVHVYTANSSGLPPTAPPAPSPTLSRRRREAGPDPQTSGGGARPRRRRQAVSGGAAAREDAGTQVYVRNCTFTDLGAGEREVALGVLTVTITGGRFLLEVDTSRFAESQRRAVHVYSAGANQGTVIIERSEFSGHRSAGPGGAVLVEQETGVVTTHLDHCSFTSNLAEAFTGGSEQLDLTKVSKTTGSGGAVAVSVQKAEASARLVRAVVDITYCTFANNTAENYGGTLYFTGGVSATVLHCLLTNVQQGGLRPRLGDILESRGNLRLTNSTLTVVSAWDSVAVVSYRADRDGSFMESSDLTINCPQGYQTEDVFNVIELGENSTRQPIETLLLFCRACKKGSYTLGQSGALVNGLQVLYTTINTCNSCPYGALCEAFVKSKNNFWGAPQGDGKVTMYGCPSGYCCPKETCDAFNQCAENREGPLCGRCRPGYSESLFSTNCVANDTCSIWSPVWALIALYGLAYVLFFLFEDELKLVVKNFVEWVQKNMAKCKLFWFESVEKEGVRKMVQDDQDPSDAYLNIFMYYIQASDLLKVDILYENNRTNPVAQFQEVILGVFSFSTLGLSPDACFFEDVTAVVKRLLQTGFIVYMLAVWLVLFSGGGLLRCCRGGPIGWITPVTLTAKFLGALVNLLLYTYQYFAENSFSLLRCITVASSPSQVLYIDGTVTCYQPWQVGVAAFTAVYVGPFFIVLLLAPGLLRARQIRVTAFLFSILLPLFGTPYLLYVWCRWKRHEGRGGAGGPQPRGGPGGSVDTITGILTDPYRQDLGGGLCWEGVIALRRLLLVLMATLITNVLYKQVAVTLVCMVALATHVWWHPFAAGVGNTVEAVSLGMLVLLSTGNLLKAVYVDAGDVPREAADRLLQAYDWLEVGLLSLLPMTILGLLALAVIVRVVSFLVKRTRRACCGPPSTSHPEEEGGGDQTLPRFRQARRKTRKTISDLHKAGVGSDGQPAKFLDNYGLEPGDDPYPTSGRRTRNWDELSADDPAPGAGGWPGGKGFNTIHTRPNYQRGDEFFDPFHQSGGENRFTDSESHTVDRTET